mmetsp:Transcript_30680/g.57776  ORF Transcript_30680/g.57776 Transcript_30680/m.57776 type:complete len:220 (-) Transcript_30680:310-969(-)
METVDGVLSAFQPRKELSNVTVLSLSDVSNLGKVVLSKLMVHALAQLRLRLLSCKSLLTGLHGLLVRFLQAGDFGAMHLTQRLHLYLVHVLGLQVGLRERHAHGLGLLQRLRVQLQLIAQLLNQHLVLRPHPVLRRLVLELELPRLLLHEVLQILHAVAVHIRRAQGLGVLLRHLELVRHVRDPPLQVWVADVLALLLQILLRFIQLPSKLHLLSTLLR